jgi:asparagine synthase (glutamine-hydrolysing)
VGAGDLRAADLCGSQWFGGWDGGADRPAVPTGAELRWSAPQPLWTVGRWNAGQVRLLRGDGWRLAVVGYTGDTDDQLRLAAERFRDRHTDWLSLRSGSAYLVWQDASRTVVVGDVAGARPIFHVRHGDAVVFASDAAPLADLIGQGPDSEWVAVNVACPELVGETGGSPFTGVRMVPAGHALVIEHRDAVSYQPDPRLTAPAVALREGAPRLRDALVHAVTEHIQPSLKVTADLSGGLDSSSVVALACRSQSSEVASLTIDSGQPDNDDLAHATAVAQSLPSLSHHVRQIPDEALPYTGLDAVPSTDEPVPDVAVYARTRWWQEQLAELGGDVHLVGDGGDAVLVANPAYLADLAAGGRMSSLLREASGWARLCRAPAARIALAAVRVAATPRNVAAHALARSIESPGNSASRPSLHEYIGLFPPPVGAAWLTADARAAAAVGIRGLRDDPQLDGWPVGDRVAMRALRAFARTHRTDRELAHHDGIRLAAPFLNDSVVRACLAVPARTRTSTTAAKPLLREALDGMVPSPTLRRSTKGDYTSLHYRGLARNARALRDIVDDLVLAQIGIVDPKAVRHTVEQGILGQRIRIGALDCILAAELWLRAHQRRPRTAWNELRREVCDEHPLPVGAACLAEPNP